MSLEIEELPKLHPLDCRSEEGITQGLVDSLIHICRVLSKRDLSNYDVEEALLDLIQDEDFNYVLNAACAVNIKRNLKSQ